MAAVAWGLVGLLVLAAPAGAQLRGLRSGTLTVYYEARDQAFAEEALHAAVAALPTLQDALGIRREDAPLITIVVTRDRRAFDAYAGEKMPPWVQGVALDGRRIILKTLAKAVMRTTTAHELTHVLLDEVAAQYKVAIPRWLHEGLAKYAADDFNQNDREVLGRAVVEGRIVGLAGVEAAFSGDRDTVSLAYAESYTLVEYLHDLRPDGGVRELLHNLELTGDMDRALLRTYGRTTEQLQEEWLQRVSREYLKHGLPFAGELLILLVMGALGLIVHLVNRRRRRIIRARLQEEDRLRRIFGVAPPASDEAPDDEPDWE